MTGRVQQLHVEAGNVIFRPDDACEGLEPHANFNM